MSHFLPGLQEALHEARVGDGPMVRKSKCSVCIVIQHTRPGAEKDTLIACAAGRISGRALHRSLRALDVNIARESISKHRNEAHKV